MDGLWQDLRYGVRLLKRTPRNSAIAVAILALGIGANTAMFSAVNHLLLRPLPFPAGERLVRVRDAVTGANGQLHPFNMSARNVMALRAHTEIFDGLVAFSGNNMTLLGADVPERVSVVFQSKETTRRSPSHQSSDAGSPPRTSGAVSTAGSRWRVTRSGRAISAAPATPSGPRSGWTRVR